MAVLGPAGSTSAATAAAQAAPGNTAAPTIVGDVQQGSGVAASTGAWSNSPTGFSYQWIRCAPSCTAISSATGQTYVVTSSDTGNTLKVTVTATNGDGSTPGDSAASTVAALPSGAPANQASPTISGTARQGQTLTAASGSWSGGTISYQWQRCDSNGNHCGSIGGATGTTYKLTSADVGHRLRVYVAAKNTLGSTGAYSKTTSVVGASAPVNTSLPGISGTLRQGSTVTASAGGWSSTLKIAVYHFQWFRCDSKGQHCTGIVGASKSSYVLVGTDVGHTLLVQVRAQTSQDSTIANSKPSGIVAGPPPSNAIAVAGLALPDRLQVDKVQFTPRKITSRKQPLVARIHVREIANGRPVSGALVRAIAIPYSRLSSARETATDGNGWATLTFTVRNTFPLRKGYLITMFVRARKPGGSVLAGISTRRLVALRVG